MLWRRQDLLGGPHSVCLVLAQPSYHRLMSVSALYARSQGDLSKPESMLTGVYSLVEKTGIPPPLQLSMFL